MSLSRKTFFISLLLFFLIIRNSFANGIIVDLTSVSALGNSYAGSAAGVHDLSDIFYNPANLGQVSSLNMIVSGGYINSNIDTDQVRLGKNTDPDANKESGNSGSGHFISAFYFASPISKKLQAAIAVTSPFDLRTNYDSNWGGKYYALDSKIKTTNLDTILSYKINDNFDLAFGTQFQHINILFNKKVNKGLNPDEKMQTKGDNNKIGYLLGLKYKINNKLKIGAGYRSRINHQIDGEFILTNTINSSLMNVKFTVPEIFNFGLAYEFNPKFQISVDSFFTRWSVMDNFTVKINSPILTSVNVPMNWKDSWMFSLGTNYQLNNKWLLRNGFAYEQSAIQTKLVNPRVPPGDRYWLTIGASYQLNSKTNIDFSFGHLFFRNINSYIESSGYLPSLNVKYKTRVDLMGISLNYKF